MELFVEGSGSSVFQALAEDFPMRSETHPHFVVDSRSADECLASLTSLWQQAQQLLQELNQCVDQDVPTRLLRELNTTLSGMLPLIVCEEGGVAPGPCLQYIVKENMLDTLYRASVRSASEEMRRMLLRLYQLWLGKSSQCLLMHEQIIRPLKRLLHSCARQQQEKRCSSAVDVALVNLLLELCEVVCKDSSLIDLFFLETSPDIGHSKFILFSFLLPYIHDEDPLGTSARDGIMILLGLSTSHPRLLRYVTENSNFCTIAIPGVTQTVLSLMHGMFLVQVMGPAFHQPNTYGRVSATAYFALFIEHVTEPLLLREFIHFLTRSVCNGKVVMDTIIKQIKVDSNRQLCAVTLSLFHTLIGLHCEEVMLQLVFKYLLPCDHIVPSQRHCIGEVDTSRTSAEKFLSLIPDCCARAERLYIESEEKSSTPASSSSPVESARSSPVPTPMGSPHVRRHNFPDDKMILESPNMSVVPSLSPTEVHYCKYLSDSRANLRRCAAGCLSWSQVYDKPSSHFPGERAVEAADSLPRTSLFLCTIIDKVSDMLSHPHHVNLLLTGLITQLALFPQPLLTSFLLSPNLNLKTAVPSLIQVLTEIKATIDELSEEYDGLDIKIARARKTLIHRELNDSLYVKPPVQAGDGEKERVRPRKKVTTSKLFAIVVYHEFLKELASIAQEQASGFSF